MVKLLWTATILLMAYAAHSYILLTANIDDLQNIAKRLIDSPVGDQVGTIMRRAYGIFNNHLSKAKNTKGQDDTDLILAYSPDEGKEGMDYRRKKDSKENENDGTEKKEQNDAKEQKDQNLHNKQDSKEQKEQNEHKKQDSKEQKEQDEQNEQKKQTTSQLNETRTDEISSLGKSASAYLEKIKNIFDNA